jgi:anaerobic ribonucleoside-triphosphate reductase
MMLQNKVDVNGDGHCYPCMGCRSFLTPYLDEGGNPKYYGRFNQGVVTINLPDVGLSAVKQMEGITYIDDEQYQKRKEEIFWTIFEERLELCHRALRLRHERLLGTLSDASPIHWQNGGLARLKKGETIDKLLYGGYSTLSLGYAGLYECVKAMTGKSHTDDEAKPFALAIMQKMNDKCAEWKAAENIDYSLYGTPIESTTYKFAKCLQSRFGVIEGITDKNYITNSYHVHVTEKINAFDKLRFESEFQQLSPGGAISYIETANLSDNVEAALSVIKYIYYHIMYAELNTKSDFCQECGYDGEIQIVENDDGKLIWKCPNCGNTNRTKMNIARRTCGYIGVNDFNQGRTQEIKERYVHLGGE